MAKTEKKEVKKFEFSKIGSILDNIAKSVPIQVEKEIKTIENRVKEYGSWQSQLDEIYHEGLDAWKTRIASIKAKYPK
jgi:hypothetical protein